MKNNHSTEWILQKIFALLFILLFAYSIYLLSDVDLKNYSATLKWFGNFWNSLVILLLIFSLIFHSNIGLSSIIDDYLHNDILKKRIIVLKNSFFITILFTTTFCLVSIIN